MKLVDLIQSARALAGASMDLQENESQQISHYRLVVTLF